MSTEYSAPMPEWISLAAAEIMVGKGKCPTCRGPLGKTIHDGCIISNCSYRPEGSHDQGRIAHRREEFQGICRIIHEHFSKSLVTTPPSEELKVIRNIIELATSSTGGWLISPSTLQWNIDRSVEQPEAPKGE